MNASKRLAALAPADLALLKARAKDFARTPDRGDAVTRSEVLVICSRRQTFALPLEAVEGIVELTSIAPVPRAPALLRGLVSFRGELMLAVELSSLIGAGDAGLADLGRVVAVSAGGKKLAVLAEKQLTVEAVDPATFRADRVAQLPFISGTDERFVSLLDIAGLIQHVFGAVGGGAR